MTRLLVLEYDTETSTLLADTGMNLPPEEPQDIRLNLLHDGSLESLFHVYVTNTDVRSCYMGDVTELYYPEDKSIEVSIPKPFDEITLVILHELKRTHLVLSYSKPFEETLQREGTGFAKSYPHVILRVDGRNQPATHLLRGKPKVA